MIVFGKIIAFWARITLSHRPAPRHARARQRRSRPGPVAAPVRLVAAALAGVLAVASGACQTSAEATPVRISWWITDYARAELWERVAADFMARRPDIALEVVSVTVEWNGNPVRSFQSWVARAVSETDEENRPDLFEQWGGANLVEQVRRGLVRDITDQVRPQLDQLGGFATPWQVGGRTYGLPYRLYLHGIWYDKTLFAQAGLATVPPTLDALIDAVPALRSAGITPMVIVGARSAELAALWLLFLLAACPRDAVARSTEELDFGHPCLGQAGDDLAAFLATGPFPADVLTTTYDAAAMTFTSGGAAMWLGTRWDWERIRDAGGDADRFGWLPLMGPDAVGLGGGNGFSCHAQAPPECVEVLTYLLSPEVQALVAAEEEAGPAALAGDPATDPTVAPTREARHRMSYLYPWPTTAYGWEMAEVLEKQVRALASGTGSPQQIVDALQAGAETIRRHCDDAPRANCRHEVSLD